MWLTRTIPCLLLKDQGLVKTIKFNNPSYVGDPINAVKIFNEKGCDELAIIDITATVENREPPFELLKEVCSEAFMPVMYGGGVKSLTHFRKLFQLGVEKVSLNSVVFENPSLVKEAAAQFGSQSVVVSVDVKKDLFGRYKITSESNKRSHKIELVDHIKNMEDLGVGEILINCIDRDGLMKGYDLELIKMVSEAVDVPVIALGGAGSTKDLAEAIIKGGASAAAAGSFFIYHGPHRAVLINYPAEGEVSQVISDLSSS